MGRFAEMQDFAIAQRGSNENMLNSFQEDSVDENSEDEEDLRFIQEVVSDYLKDL